MATNLDPAIMETKFNAVCERARARSLQFTCTVHVYAIIERLGGMPCITGFGVSDGYDGATVSTYTNGKGE